MQFREENASLNEKAVPFYTVCFCSTLLRNRYTASVERIAQQNVDLGLNVRLQRIRYLLRSDAEQKRIHRMFDDLSTADAFQDED